MTSKPLAFSIAWRYLSAPKSHGAVNAISIISVAGVAVATAAIVIVLSVFNGFKTHLNARLNTLAPDVSVTTVKGKTIPNGDSIAQVLSVFPGVEIAMPSLTDNALVIYDSREMPVTLKGVNLRIYPEITSVDSLILDGIPLADYAEGESSISVGVAKRLGIYSAGEMLTIFAPKREGRVNLANPISSFIIDSIKASSVFRSLENEYDDNTIICDISLARELFQYDTEATSIEIKAKEGTDPQKLSTEISDYLGEEFLVKDRIRLQEVNFKMVSIEKWITFLLLTFILLIASFNIISTLCMLIIEKQNSLKILADIGMSKKRIGQVFWWESMLVTMSGATAGIFLGVILSLLQEKFGLIKLAGDPESLVILAYPVKLEWIDLAVTFIPILIIGFITAWISSSFARSLLHNSDKFS